MDLIPAVDIKNGRCVRLYQGDYSRETVYSDNPIEVAIAWECQGAKRLHVVDLDGAKTGEPVNIEVLEKIIESVTVPVQFGGGIRTVQSADLVFSMGVDRIIFGTVAIEEPSIIEKVSNSNGIESVMVGLDAVNGHVAVRGWTINNKVKASDLMHSMIGCGVRRFMYTDISRDGTLTEPNFRAVQDLVDSTESPILAAGGVSSIDHLQQLNSIGVEGVVVGKALYTGDINLSDALVTLSDPIN